MAQVLSQHNALPPSIAITHQAGQELAAVVAALQPSKIAVLTDTNSHTHCYPLLAQVLPAHEVLTVQAGEEHKNLDTCQEIWKALTELGFDRKALLINVGGGVVTDMGGFCAATYKRGIRFVNLPTTLLSQVDASVGGKLGVDFMGFKNHIGVFQEPEKVIIDPVFLKTLPTKERRSGFAEVIKHSLIADAAYWQELTALAWDEQPWGQRIEHSVKVKYGVVQQDPTEKGLRKILNFGHTVGHAVESFYLEKQRLLHGEAIAIGMICEAWLAHKKLNLPMEQVVAIQGYIFKAFGKVGINHKHFPEIALLAQQDKKNTAGTIQCVLLDEIGKAHYDVPVTIEEIIDSLFYYEKQKG